MKITTPFIKIEIETIFLIVVLISIFSEVFQKYMLSYYICYLFILFHELAHMFVAVSFGIEIKGIKFTISGVCINIDKDKMYSLKMRMPSILRNIFIYLAGPLSNFLLAFIFRNVKMVFEINIFLGFLNLLPIYPLDGYNILKNLLYIYNKIHSDIILEYVENIFIILLFLLSMIQFVIYNNISVFIFVVYVYVIKKVSDKEKNIARIVRKSIY